MRDTTAAVLLERIRRLSRGCFRFEQMGEGSVRALQMNYMNGLALYGTSLQFSDNFQAQVALKYDGRKARQSYHGGTPVPVHPEMLSDVCNGKNPQHSPGLRRPPATSNGLHFGILSLIQRTTEQDAAFGTPGTDDDDNYMLTYEIALADELRLRSISPFSGA